MPIKITQRQLAEIIREEARKLQLGVSSYEEMSAAVDNIKPALRAAIEVAGQYHKKIHERLKRVEQTLDSINTDVRIFWKYRDSINDDDDDDDDYPNYDYSYK